MTACLPSGLIERAKIDKEAAWAAREVMDSLARTSGTILPDIRQQIFEQANWRCCYCGVRMFSHSLWAQEDKQAHILCHGVGRVTKRQFRRRMATIEHIIRRADGGFDLPSNLAAACDWCNGSRGSRSAEDWLEEVAKMKLSGCHPNWPKD